MKYIIGSDIHGSLYYGLRLIELLEQEQADKLIILGDLYYHGPRNPFPKEYNPAKLAESLNQIKNKLIVIKGNCDSEVDEMISDFGFLPTHTMPFFNYNLILTHGHNYEVLNPKLNSGDILLYGHYHLPVLRTLENDKIIASPGSVSLPKNDSKRAYIILSENAIILKELDNGKIIQKESLCLN
ncbi:MAG: phosphodiesterase [Christensenellaceae bacterium]|jgi:putative phosphoesterase|nr:phosphodiesterase [Christensenellaceae bacterium]